MMYAYKGSPVTITKKGLFTQDKEKIINTKFLIANLILLIAYCSLNEKFHSILTIYTE